MVCRNRGVMATIGYTQQVPRSIHASLYSYASADLEYQAGRYQDLLMTSSVIGCGNLFISLDHLSRIPQLYPPSTRRVLCAARCPGLPSADWGVEPDVVAKLGLQA